MARLARRCVSNPAYDFTITAHRFLNRPSRPFSRGFDPASYPTEPFVSYQTNRLLSGWNLPPLVIRAIGEHCIRRVSV